MVIEENIKFVYSDTYDKFINQLNIGNVGSSSIVFINDTSQIWARGTFYCTKLTAAEVEAIVISSSSIEQFVIQLISDVTNGVVLDNTGGGTKFLSDDGTYKTIKTSSGSGSSPEVSTKGGVILFETETSQANYGDITLSQSADNYSQLDICCCTDVGETVFISVYNPNNSIANISSSIQESGELIIKSKQYEIRNDTILTINGIGGMASISSNGIATVEGNYIGIYKVIGYE